MLGLYNTFAGGASDRCAIRALGIMPYISATIIMQLLTAVWPRLSKLAREQDGRDQNHPIRTLPDPSALRWPGRAYFANGWLHPQSSVAAGSH